MLHKIRATLFMDNFGEFLFDKYRATYGNLVKHKSLFKVLKFIFLISLIQFMFPERRLHFQYSCQTVRFLGGRGAILYPPTAADTPMYAYMSLRPINQTKYHELNYWMKN